MPHEIDDPNSGQRVVFVREEPDALVVDLYVRAGGYVRDHVHPSQEETFELVAGTFVLDVNGGRRAVAVGSSETVRQRMTHGFAPADGDAQLRVTVRPALELGGYFRDYLMLSRDGRLRIPPSGLPRPVLLFAALMHRYRREIAAPAIPLWLQRPLWRVLAWVGGLFGQKL